MQKNIYVIDHTFYDPEEASNSPKADSWKRATDAWDGASTVEASASKKKKKVGITLQSMMNAKLSEHRF